MSKTIDVFGVSNNIIESYIERPQIDGSFLTALKLNKQIVVYGSSKQGKTALIKKHLKTDSTVYIQCSPKTEAKDIYSSILRQNDIQILTELSEQETESGTVNSSINTKVRIPILLDAGGGLSGTLSGEQSQSSRIIKKHQVP